MEKSVQNIDQGKKFSTALLELEAKDGNASASSSIESKLLCCKRDDFLKPRKAKSDKISIPDRKPNISAVPESGVLDKVKNFLEVFAEANKKLQVDDERAKYDIETLTGDETELIEMDLMLGVADLHTPEAVAAAEAAMAGCQPSTSFAADDSSDDDDETDDDSDSDNENEEKTSKPKGNAEGYCCEAVEELKPLKGRQKRQKIVELS